MKKRKRNERNERKVYSIEENVYKYVWKTILINKHNESNVEEIMAKACNEMW